MAVLRTFAILAALITAVAAADARAQTMQEEMVFWQSVEDSNDIAMLKAYKHRYPDGAFVELADLKIAAIIRKQKESQNLQTLFEDLIVSALENNEHHSDERVQAILELLKTGSESNEHHSDEGAQTLTGPAAKMTISEIDTVSRQITPCWEVPASAKGAENLVIEIKASMNRDGTVAVAKIADSARVRSDSFYRTAAESALRAVLNPKCQPFKLPPEKYADWREMTLVFDLREMF